MQSLARASVAALVLGAAGTACGPAIGPAKPPDSGVPDSGVGGGGSDAGASEGMPDLSPMQAGPDLAQPIVRGLTWPADQIFPSFAPPGPLDVVEGKGRAVDLMTMVISLQGVINRWQPRIFVHDQADDGDALWLTELGIVNTVVPDPLTLITKYRSELAGMIIYD